MAYQTITVRHDNGVDWVTFNRPEALNTISPEMAQELQDYFGALYTDHSVRIVVLKGAGRAFCAGLDLKGDNETGAGSTISGSVAHTLRFQRRISEIVMRMRRCPQAIIALVHGPACGGGFAMALAADIRIAGESAKMNAAFIKIGLSGCDIGVSYMLPRLVGVSVATELIMTGRFVNAERALRINLISEVVPDDHLETAAQGYIDDLLRTSPLGLRLTKECLNMSVDAGSMEAAVAMEDRNQVLTTKTQDFAEGVAAFIEKRMPVYRDC
jgi:enoyl-CoA hydratase